ncbi:hypothetical protein [Lacticaseibacillus kribbianus]|uniref:hypothetical protein n=1 Tax=Lacticaseibacillus kribbianus TaxID=2926292 RepID=UPI001CD2925F|nr:hypothetical protein [Lacticaseibacillus kribbianus]
MKRIKDERLIQRNLKNIKAAFAVENLFIAAVLGVMLWRGQAYEDVISYRQPLFAALMVGCYTVLILSVNISTPMQDAPLRSWRFLAAMTTGTWVLAGGLFFVIAGFTHPVICALAGLVVAAVVGGINLYANHFRDRS